VTGISFEAPRPYVSLPARLAVLLSGRGSNFEALADGCDRGQIPARIVLVVSDKVAAEGLVKADRRGIATKVIEKAAGPWRERGELALISALEEARVDLICLAGFMRLLSPSFVKRYPLHILNVHPALLPSFPGLHAQEQAIRHGVRVSGATVHFVDAGADTGPIVEQRAVLVEPGDDAESLSSRILPVEHEIYVAAVRQVLQGGWRIDGRAVRLPADA
jgi:phosphoribosylglycinamide formyltransferase-1